MLNGLMKSNGWFPTMFDDFFNTDFMPRANSTAPAVNVKESEKAYTMELAAPGIKKEFCRVGINEEGNLTIAIENKVEHKQEDKHHHYLRREFSYSNYEQAYTLPDDVERDQISAKVEDGILTVTMPKLAKEQKKCTKAIEVS
jgi:HSP20 family protein